MRRRQLQYHGPQYPSVSRRSDRNASRVVRSILRAPFTAETWRRTAYGSLCLPVAIVGFVLTIPLFLVGTPLIIVVGLGFVLSSFALWLSRGFVRLERARVAGMLGLAIPPLDEPVVTGHLARRWWTRCRTPRTWLTLAFVLTNVPLSLLVFFLCCYPWVQTVYSLSYPILQWNTTFSEHAWGGPSWLGAVAVHTLPGIPMLFAAPWLVAVATTAHARWARFLLGGSSR